jgi:predicted GH43/DUF377 family glycosyl hydrolase
MPEAPHFQRCPENPIVRAGLYPWREAVTFNPGALYEDGRFYLYERTAGELRPFCCYIGMLESDDGIHFRPTQEEPVVTPEMLGSRYGSVQDARVGRIGDTYYMTYAYRPYAWHIMPTGLGVPDATQGEYPGFDGLPTGNQSRSGIAASSDRVHWEHLGWVNGPEIDDRDVVLFPEKINGRYAVLRRPIGQVSTDTGHSEEHPSIQLSYSDDLVRWTEPEVVARPAFAWEDNRIGASPPPIRTDRGWLVLYHGVQNAHPPTRRVIYRLGAMILDLENPTRVLARCPHAVMEPEAYYELFGLVIPNVVFPTGAVDVDGVLHLYYGVCDTAIGLATVPLRGLVEYVWSVGRSEAGSG